jgi:hypothetical protein
MIARSDVPWRVSMDVKAETCRCTPHQGTIAAAMTAVNLWLNDLNDFAVKLTMIKAVARSKCSDLHMKTSRIDLRALPHGFAKDDELLRIRQCGCQWSEEC